MFDKKIRIIKGTISYSAGNYTAIAIGVFISIFSKRILGVEGAGQWAVLVIFLSYGLIVGSLGIEIAIVREIPQTKGRDEHDEIASLINTAFTFSVILGILISLCYIGIARFFVKDMVINRALLFLTILMLFTLLYNLNLSILRANKAITALSKIIVINTILVGSISLTLAYFYGVVGYLTGTIISTLLSFFISARLGGIKYKWLPDLKKAIRLIAIGFPMLLASVIENTFLSIDRIVIGAALGAQALGLYTIAIMSTQHLTSLPRFFQTVLFPYVQEDYGKDKSIKELSPYFARSMYIMSRALPFMIGLIIFTIPMVVVYFLPKFKEGLLAMQILVCGFYFVAINETNTMFIYTINKQKLLPFLYAIMLLLNAALSYAAALWGYGILGVALASAVSYMVFFIVTSCYVYSHFMSLKNGFFYFLKLFGFYLYIVLVIIIINGFLAGFSISAFLCRITALIILYMPVFVMLEKREKLFSISRSVIAQYLFRKKPA